MDCAIVLSFSGGSQPLLAVADRESGERWWHRRRSFLLCIYACMCMRVSNVVSSSPSSVGPDICASFFPFATTALCCCLLGSFPYPPVLLFRSSRSVPRCRQPSFALSRHRVAHTLRGRQRSEGTGPTEDRKDNVNAASLSFSLPSLASDGFSEWNAKKKKPLQI